MFKKFSSIENSYRTKFLNKVIEEGHGDKEYIVQEKVHGANFSFVVNSESVQMAKRSGIIAEDEVFFNANAVYDKYVDKVRRVFDTLVATANEYGKSVENVQIFGEIYGGKYEHPDVGVKSTGSIQKEIQYSTEQDFIAFDIMVDGRFLSVEATEIYCERSNIPYSKVLFRGSLEEALKYPNTYLTTIPAMHGLPDIEGNFCEGNIIRPIDNNLYLWNNTRLIIKNKNEKFAEKSGQKKPKTTKMPERIPEELIPYIDKAEQYITENRLKNVLSKLGEVKQGDFGKLVGLLSQDIIQDFLKDEESFTELGKQARGMVTKQISKSAALLVRNNFVNILDGEF